MAIDYVSTLNKSGSGLNTTEIVTSLVDAEIVPKKDAIQERITAAETSITALGKVRSEFETFSTALKSLKSFSLKQIGTTDPNISATITDPHKVPDGSSSLSVTQIAQAQVLEFTGFTGPDHVMDAGSLSVEFGEWDMDKNPSFTADAERGLSDLTFETGATLKDVADALNEIEGVKARVIDKGDGTFSLGIASDVGAKNGIRITGTGTGDLALVDISTKQKYQDTAVQSAQDAILQLDGITVTRPTNTLKDVLPGVELTLFGATEKPAEVVVATDVNGARNALQDLVDKVNNLSGLLRTETNRGTDGSEAGALAGDRVAGALLTNLGKLTTTPISGFGNQNYFLSQFGIRTERDGTLTLDADTFTTAFESNPNLVDAVFSDRYSTTTEGVEVSGKFYDSTAAGSYSFTYDPETGKGNLAGQELVATELEDGRLAFFSINGPTRGMSITIEPTVTQATLTVGRSLVSTLSQNVKDVLSSSGEIARREDYFGDIVTDENVALEELDAKATAIEERYRAKFAAMEQIVTQLKGTGTYITNLIDAWQAAKNQ